MLLLVTCIFAISSAFCLLFKADVPLMDDGFTHSNKVSFNLRCNTFFTFSPPLSRGNTVHVYL